MSIESQKLNDTGQRLRRLNDEFVQKTINDQYSVATKEELKFITDDGDLTRGLASRVQKFAEVAAQEQRSDLTRLEKQFHDREKPFFRVFGEELITHKSKTQCHIEDIRKEFINQKDTAQSSIMKLSHDVAILQAKVSASEGQLS